MEEDRGDQKPLELAIKRILSSKTTRDNNGGGTLLRMILASSVSGGIHYGWGLQISILTPYAQILGIPHMFACFICSSGPLAGILVNPILNYYSERCTMRMGRRRPFILLGCFLLSISALVIGYSPDIGHYLGDPYKRCDAASKRFGASAMLIIGFFLLDFANCAVRGMAQAMMDDVSVGNTQYGPQIGYDLFCLWGTLGVILGLAASAASKWSKWFPWLETEACCGVCANIKGACIANVVYLVVTMTLTMIFADEKPIEKEDVDTSSSAPSFGHPLRCLKHMSRCTKQLFVLTVVSWLALYPFYIYNTDWMGREIYHGDPQGKTNEELQMYTNGFRQGCYGLIFCVLGRLFTTPVTPKLCQKLTVKFVWALSNFVLCLVMLTAAIVSIFSDRKDPHPWSSGHVDPDKTLKALALAIFAVVGIAGTMTQTLPTVIALQIAATEGRDSQGDTLGAITIAIIVPQFICVLMTGPIDAFYGQGGNAPGFFLSAALAFLSWLLGLLLLSKKGDIASRMPLL